MKNPHIKATLINMMNQERADKLEAIATIIAHKVRTEPNTDETELFNELYDINKRQLGYYLDEIINDNLQEIESLMRENNDFN